MQIQKGEPGRFVKRKPFERGRRTDVRGRCDSPSSTRRIEHLVAAREQFFCVGAEARRSLVTILGESAGSVSGQIPQTHLFPTRSRQPPAIGGKRRPYQSPTQVLAEFTMVFR